MDKVKRFAQNEQGKDFIVGDLHGCYEDFLQALKAIKFNETTDRVFSVGDLIDRGPYSEECVELIRRPWFHAVRGNHEDMMILSVLKNNYESSRIWQSNGGHWIYEPSTWTPRFSDQRLKELATLLDSLPYVIVVGEGENRYNIVHAEFVRSNWNSTSQVVADTDIDEWTFSQYEENSMLWGRTLIKFPVMADPAQQAGLSPTYVGHTPLRQLARRLKHYYLDLGCVYFHTSKKTDDQTLALACPQDRTVHLWSPMWKRVHTVDYDSFVDVDTKLNTSGAKA